MHKIIVHAIAAILSQGNDEDGCVEISDISLFRKLDGTVLDADPVSDYLDGGNKQEIELYNIGLRGGDIKLVLDENKKRLLCHIEFTSPQLLTNDELKTLRNYTEGQVLDGIGENGFELDLPNNYFLGIAFDAYDKSSITQHT